MVDFSQALRPMLIRGIHYATGWLVADFVVGFGVSLRVIRNCERNQCDDFAFLDRQTASQFFCNEI